MMKKLVTVMGVLALAGTALATTDWMPGKVGAFAHYLPNAKTYAKIDDFDVKGLVAQLKEMRADYFVITLGQNSGYYCSPNETLEKLAKYEPHARCSKRDIPAEIIAALKGTGIRFGLYLPSQPAVHDDQAETNLGFLSSVNARGGDPDRKFTDAGTANWAKVIETWARRYGKDVSFWWFDGSYAWLGFNGDIAARYRAACQAGNPDVAIAFNAGDKYKGAEKWSDVWAGEESARVLSVFPTSRWAAPNLQWQVLSYLGKTWGEPSCRFTDEQWRTWLTAVTAKGGCVTLDMHIDPATGRLEPAQVDQFRRVRPAVDSIHAAKSAAERGAWFREARFGMFIHWGLYAIPGEGEWTYATKAWPKGAYEAFAKKFNPTKYDPRAWAKLAKAAGMKYAVLTSRHHDGFCMFDSHFTDYKITNTPYGKDAVRMFVDAFRAEGLKVGFYHSLPDWTHPGYADRESPEYIQRKELHVPTAGQKAAFRELVFNHVNQLMTEYGKIDLLFLDYTSVHKANEDYFDRERILKAVYAAQPDILVNDRLSYWKDNCRDFDYYTPEICVPNQPQRVKGREVMWETCATMNDNWGYNRRDKAFKTPEALVAGLVGCVAQNGNLLLNVGPTETGEIPSESVARLEALAAWYAKNGESVTGCGRSEFRPPFGCAYTQKGNALYCHFLQVPLGDVILPQLKGRIAKATLLRTGAELAQVNDWGFELLQPDEQRLRTRGLRVGDVVRLDLR